MDPPRFLHRGGHVLLSLLLMALVAPSARSLPSNGSDATKDSNRPSLELSFTNKLVKSEVGAKNQEGLVNDSAVTASTVGSAVKSKSPVSVRPITKENSTKVLLSTTLAPTPRTTSWLPYYLSSEAFARAAPSVALDPGAIREGDAESSRGRSGSPRRIDNFPPLQNQPGEEYLDAINRRTVVPPPPVVATTPAAVTTTKPTILPSSTVKLTTLLSTTTKKATEPPQKAGPVSSLAFDSTTVDSEPDIGTAFSLSEDFTQEFFPVSEMLPAADRPVKTPAPKPDNATEPRPAPPSNSTSNATQVAATPPPKDANLIDSTLKQSPAALSPTTTTPSVPTSAPASTTKEPSRSSPAPKAVTTVPASTAQPSPPTTPPPPPPTTSAKPATKRPTLRRRLPNFRATSPRPTIRRRLPGPVPTTETAFRQPPTTAAVAVPESPVAEEEDVAPPPVTPVTPPVQPTTARREYVMTVPPLLDFDNVARDDAASDSELGDASLEATHLTSPGHGGGGIIPEGATSAIIISGIIGGCAILFFAVLMVFCMWRQHVSRRPIYPPPESSNSSSTSSTAFHSKLG